MSNVKIKAEFEGVAKFVDVLLKDLTVVRVSQAICEKFGISGAVALRYNETAVETDDQLRTSLKHAQTSGARFFTLHATANPEGSPNTSQPQPAPSPQPATAPPAQKQTVSASPSKPAEAPKQAAEPRTTTPPKPATAAAPTAPRSASPPKTAAPAPRSTSPPMAGPSVKFCPHCGAPASGGKFCTECGGVLAKPPIISSEAENSGTIKPQKATSSSSSSSPPRTGPSSTSPPRTAASPPRTSSSEEHTGPRVLCATCGKDISGPGIKALDKTYHRQCFNCVVCNKSLLHTAFAKDDDNQPICASCFEDKYSKKCARCQRNITGGYVVIDEQPMHEDCFTCDTCQSKITGAYAKTDEGQYLCRNCA